MFGLELLEVEVPNFEKAYCFLDYVKDHQERVRILQRIERKIQKIRSALTRGVPQGEFIKTKILLEGYLILQRLLKEVK
ncbi:DUF5398 family protein [Candidatus Similichlamydia laticola]|uniref:Uncharacterized protein n=1 Tax=Candidatus Similichlamydia laticola TaxID=2170265 RepID=A0A369KLC5_9BACT|nr:DUF5398 family protein [Candidatus Similichlamydia laticola]RDB31813.1 hypothetical protein HAT2_00078 [Candidatus Similichlamydia laticola]RDB31816.1 hypothetical protein HAT2_00075 [Candidatus Similichlamydia laticola]